MHQEINHIHDIRMNDENKIILYQDDDEITRVSVRFADEDLWLTQKQLAEIYCTTKQNISQHIDNILNDGELDPNRTVKDFLTVRQEGKRQVQRSVLHYNLDMVIAVGYRVNSRRATQFRQWCTFVLRQYAIRGYVMDKKRMENGSFIGVDYFEQLLEEIREIRLSERNFYQKLTDIYATAIDYNRDAPTTRDFFKKVQNKMHYAVHGHTAAELIVERADADKEHMGLTTWAKAPNGKIIRSDVSVAKNYLKQNELQALGRLVNAYLDMAKDMAERHIPMTMEDWAKRIDKFLDATNRDILQGAGSITAEYAKQYAESEFEKYRVIQDRLFRSDFDLLNENQTTIPYEEL